MFFFHCYLDHRALHSFPTRRSSDLVAMSISPARRRTASVAVRCSSTVRCAVVTQVILEPVPRDRKSTRLNSSHPSISYAVFCLKKKKKNNHERCADIQFM